MSNYRTTGSFSNNIYNSVEDPTALKPQTTELQANFWTLCWNQGKTRQLLDAKLQNYRLIFEQYLEIGGRPDSSKGWNYRTTGRFFHNKFKPVEDPTALSCQTTELQANFRTISTIQWKTRQLWGLKLQNYRQIFEHYVEIRGRPDSS